MRRAQGRAPDIEAHGRRVPRVVDIVVRREIGLPGRQLLAEGLLAIPGRGQLLDFRRERIGHRLETEARLDVAGEALRAFVPLRRADTLEVAPGDLGHGMIGEPGAGAGDPGRGDLAMAHRRAVLGIAVEHLEDALAHGKVRCTQRILDLAEAGGEIVGRRLARMQDELVEAPAAVMGQHRLLHVFRRGVHQAHRIDRARRPRRCVAVGDPCHRAGILPGFRVLALEGVDAAPIGRAVRVPEAAVGKPRERMRVEAEGGVEVVVITLGGMDGLGAAHLLGRLAEEFQPALDAVLLHDVLGGEEAGERAEAERGMRVGVTGGVAADARARLAPRHRRL